MRYILLSAALAAASVQAGSAEPVALDIHGSSPYGINLHVKSITLHEDRTDLQIAVSYANPRRPDGVTLAGYETFLRTETGDRLMLQRKGQDDKLAIANNTNLEGGLNFQGALPKDSRSITLVLNDGTDENHSRSPHFAMKIDLPENLPATVTSVTRGLPEGSRYPVQADNGAGLTVQVKNILSEGNITRLQGTLSFSNLRRPEGAQLAGGNTFLRVNGNTVLPLQAMAENPKLTVANHDSLSGELIFQGHIPSGAQSLELVINEGRDPNSSRTPGITLPLPLP